ncbi:MAG: cyclic nucleotide-binding domain-containing protein [Burkholderiaceae bacterium]
MNVAIRDIGRILAEHPVFRAFDRDAIELLAGCARNERFRPGTLIFREGDAATRLYLLRAGTVAIEIGGPQRPPLIIETLHAGEILGWSWLVPPHLHSADARAIDDVRAVSLDAGCLRDKCDREPALGYLMFKTWSPHMVRRMHAMRLQALDLYGAPGG